MIFQIDKIMQDVRICLDQNMESDALIESGDIDTLALDEIIKSKILEAIQRVHRDAPNYLLEGGHNFGDAVYWRELESGWVLLPKDFLRLVVFEMDDIDYFRKKLGEWKERVSKAHISELDGSVSVTVGCASGKVNSIEDFTNLIKSADSELYQNKGKKKT